MPPRTLIATLLTATLLSACGNDQHNESRTWLKDNWNDELQAAANLPVSTINHEPVADTDPHLIRNNGLKFKGPARPHTIQRRSDSQTVFHWNDPKLSIVVTGPKDATTMADEILEGWAMLSPAPLPDSTLKQIGEAIDTDWIALEQRMRQARDLDASAIDKLIQPELIDTIYKTVRLHNTRAAFQLERDSLFVSASILRKMPGAFLDIRDQRTQRYWLIGVISNDANLTESAAHAVLESLDLEA